MTLKASPFPTFQMMMLLSLPPDSKMFCADGCQSTNPTRRYKKFKLHMEILPLEMKIGTWCFMRSTMGSVMFLTNPLSGICQTLTTQSSEAEAITLSLWGHHAISRTGPLWPPTWIKGCFINPCCSKERNQFFTTYQWYIWIEPADFLKRQDKKCSTST